MFYCVDTKTGKRASLQTCNEDASHQIIEAKNQAERQPMLNLQIAKAYLAGSDSGIGQRTWQQAIETLIASKHGANQERWRRAATERNAPIEHEEDADIPSSNGRLFLTCVLAGRPARTDVRGYGAGSSDCIASAGLPARGAVAPVPNV